MHKPINPRLHGMLDYATTTATAIVPKALDFPKPAATLCEALAGGYGSLSAFTDYPLSLKRVIPFKAHGATEVAIGLALPFLPRALGFSEHRAARNYVLGLAALTFVVAALTDWDKTDSPPSTR